MITSFKVGDTVAPKSGLAFAGMPGTVSSVGHDCIYVKFTHHPQDLFYMPHEVTLVSSATPVHAAVHDTLSDLDEQIEEAEATVKALYAIRDAVSKVRV